ncbi:non-homologous end-joining DNA ligase [Actinacidiphila acididurans]|uniref:Non-homologous end-joining DNA ligase n=1 Tax=Actinacidiphila acididurans TaxID=2784346 RepID=A0ABS2TLE0_9ACTN|nr:non-homologous end-joining DNA ligase [Actinacidiphila acididurans]MBM9504153.1 non-homologous end-joining DNA ligase [Actinacidiphila acididurans]
MTTQPMTVRLGGHPVRITHPNKVLFPGDGLTKADLVGYYRTVARRMLPHLRGRPLMLERHPSGTDDPGFMQKDVPDSFPDWIRRVELPKQGGGSVRYAVCDDTATLAYLVGQNCTTFHRFLSTADHPDRPDRIVFDLDPPDADFAPVRQAALLLRDVLRDLELPSLLMSTGSRGLHAVIPLDTGGGADFDQARAFAHDVAELLVARRPDALTIEPRKAARAGRLYVDVQRNAYAQTAVAPYSLRPLPGAPIAAPLAWDDIEDPDLTPRRWTLSRADELLRTDPWHNAPRGHSLAAARRRLTALQQQA